jgi:hypothetical protein
MLGKCSLTLSGTTSRKASFTMSTSPTSCFESSRAISAVFPVPMYRIGTLHVARLDRPGDLESVQMEFDSGVGSGRTRATACFLLCEDEEADLLDVTISSFQLSAA